MAPETLVTAVLFGFTAGFSLFKGAKPEQFGGLLLLLWLGLDRGYHFSGSYRLFVDLFDWVDPVVATLDVTVLLVLIVLALAANRLWPMFAASAQCVTVIGHVSILITPGMQRAYWAMTQVPPLLVALAVFGGTLAHMVRIRRLGHYRDWRRPHRFV